MVVHITKLCGLIPVWMTLIFTEGRMITGKLEQVQLFCCKVAWSSSVVRDGSLNKGEDWEVLWVWRMWIIWAFAPLAFLLFWLLFFCLFVCCCFGVVLCFLYRCWHSQIGFCWWLPFKEFASPLATSSHLFVCAKKNQKIHIEKQTNKQNAKTKHNNRPINQTNTKKWLKSAPSQNNLFLHQPVPSKIF